MSRNLSIQKHFEYLASKHEPRFRFEGGSKNDWRAWREQLLLEAVASLGQRPDRVPLNSQVIAEWHDDGLIKRKIVFDVEEGLSASALLFRPENATGRLPAILCCHGHGDFGKDSVMGNRATPEQGALIDQHNYDYGLQMAKAGFATLAIDWRGFGERDDRKAPLWHDLTHGRDLCNVHYVRENILGRTLLGMNVHDAQCALDYLCDQDFVDPNKIGIMGLSFGGTMTVWTSLCDQRIKAANVICYSVEFADFALRAGNFCGSQMSPGIYDLCDVADLQGLIAPRPLLVEIGSYDEGFFLDSAIRCHRRVEGIYAAAGTSERLRLDLFEGGHAWGGNQSVAFFLRWLNGEAPQCPDRVRPKHSADL